MADATAVQMPPYSNNSGLYMIPVGTLAALSLILVVLRIYTRRRRAGKLYIDDKLIIVAETISIANVCIAGAAVSTGWGKPVAYLTPKDVKNTLQLNFAVQTTWLFSFCLTRVSVAASLLRYGQDRLWRWPLYFLIGLQICISSSYLVMQFAQCTPVSSNWENVPDVKCWPVQPIIDYGWAIAAVYVTMDLILSLMPIRLIRTLTRSTSEKILIGALMALGLLATVIAGLKMTTFKEFGKGDPMQQTVRPSLYAKMEEQVGIIALSLPCLKAPVERLLKRLGILKEHHLTRPSFVNTMSLHDARKEPDQRSSSEGSLRRGKSDVRIDSLGVMPSSSTNSNAHTRGNIPGNNDWNAV